jgi:hypothetical protein
MIFFKNTYCKERGKRNAMCIAALYIIQKENKTMFIGHRRGSTFLQSLSPSISKTPIISGTSHLNQLWAMAAPLATIFVLSLVLILLEDN